MTGFVKENLENSYLALLSDDVYNAVDVYAHKYVWLNLRKGRRFQGFPIVGPLLPIGTLSKQWTKIIMYINENWSMVSHVQRPIFVL